MARVNGGESFDPETSADDYLAVSELNGLAPGAGYWLDVPEMTVNWSRKSLTTWRYFVRA